jgi:hypothetical protein
MEDVRNDAKKYETTYKSVQVGDCGKVQKEV